VFHLQQQIGERSHRPAYFALASSRSGDSSHLKPSLALASLGSSDQSLNVAMTLALVLDVQLLLLHHRTMFAYRNPP